jgi:hypothetical protein
MVVICISQPPVVVIDSDEGGNTPLRVCKGEGYGMEIGGGRCMGMQERGWG